MKEKYRVLIVDDQPWIRDMLSEVIISSGYLAYVASNGVEALETAQKEKPDIALVDINLPDISGFKLLDHFIKMSPSIKTILMSGLSDSNIAEKAHKAGASAFLVKPFDIFEAIELLKKVLE